jgi:hypothetical protein
MANWFIAPAAAQGGIGSDSNAGTSAAAPFATFTKAASVATAGSIVTVASGNYPGGFTLNCAGISGNPIVFQAAKRWGPTITVPASNIVEVMFQVGGSGTGGTVGAYVTVDGIHVDLTTYTTGTKPTSGIWCFGNGDIVQNCHVHGVNTASTSGGGGILMDGYYGGTNMSCLGNYVHDIIGTGSAIFLYQCIYFMTNGVIQNNLCINTSSDCISSFHGATTLYISNNTCITGHTGITIAAGNATGAQYQTAGNNNGRIFNNILVNCGYGIFEEFDTPSTGTGNQYQNNDIYLCSTNTNLVTGTASGNITTNPLFVNYNSGAPGGDFHLQSTSPCINAGLSGLTPAIAPSVDFDKNARPASTNWTIGAYERSTAVQVHLGIAGWSNATYSAGARRSNAGMAYQCTTGGTSTSPPTGAGTGINNGGVAIWKSLSQIDYTTLAAWAADTAALPATLTKPALALLWNDSTVVATLGTRILWLTGHTTSSTNTITVKPAPGESFQSVYVAAPTTAYAYNAANGVALQLPASGVGGINYIQLDDSWVTLDGIQFKDPNSTSGSTIIGGTGSNNTIKHCIIDGFGQAGAPIVSLDGNNPTITNSLIIARNTSASGEAFKCSGFTGAIIVNNTFVHTTLTAGQRALASGTNTTNATMVSKNNIFVNYDIVYGASSGTPWISNNCAYTAASFSGSNQGTDAGGSVFGITTANTFANYPTDFNTKSGSACLNAGETDTTDIPAADDAFGNSRPQGVNWDIGAVELLAAGSTVTRDFIANLMILQTMPFDQVFALERKQSFVVAMNAPIEFQNNFIAPHPITTQGDISAEDPSEFPQPAKSILPGIFPNLASALIAWTSRPSGSNGELAHHRRRGMRLSALNGELADSRILSRQKRYFKPHQRCCPHGHRHSRRPLDWDRSPSIRSLRLSGAAQRYQGPSHSAGDGAIRPAINCSSSRAEARSAAGHRRLRRVQRLCDIRSQHGGQHRVEAIACRKCHRVRVVGYSYHILGCEYLG